MYNPNEEIGWGAKAIIVWGLAILVVVLLAVVGSYALYPKLLEWQTKADQNSPQFVISAQTDISNAISHYDGLQTQITELSAQPGNEQLVQDMKDQQNNDVCDVRRAADLLQVDTHPERLTNRARNFLAEHQSVVCK